MDSKIVSLGNDNGRYVLKLRTNHLRFPERTMLSLLDPLYTPGVRYFLVSSVPKISFLKFRLDVLDIVWNGDSFGHVTLKGVFNGRDKNIFYPCPFFDSVLDMLDLTIRVKIRINELAKYGFLKTNSLGLRCKM